MNKLWRTFRGVLGDTILNVHDDHTADNFATFFQDKVDVVCASTATTPSHDGRWPLKLLVTGLLLQLTKLLN